MRAAMQLLQPTRPRHLLNRKLRRRTAVRAQGEAPATGSRVVADAKVVPVQSANLSMSAGGIVKQLTVQEGDTVANGQVLIKLDDAQQRVAVAQAQANLQSAQANLDELLAGARTQEIAQAEAGVVAAQAAYNRLANAGSPGSIAAAQASSCAGAGQSAASVGRPHRRTIDCSNG